MNFETKWLQMLFKDQLDNPRQRVPLNKFTSQNVIVSVFLFVVLQDTLSITPALPRQARPCSSTRYSQRTQEGNKKNAVTGQLNNLSVFLHFFDRNKLTSLLQQQRVIKL